MNEDRFLAPGGCRAKISFVALRLSARRLAPSGFLPVALVYLLAIAAAELLVALVSPLTGILLHIGVLVSLLVHGSLATDQPSSRFLLSLSLAPLIRLLSLSMPLSPFAPIYWYFIISIPLALALVIALRRLGLKPGEIGLNFRNLPLQLPIALAGLVLGGVEYLILKPQPLASSLSLGDLALPALILFFSTGLVEEVTFRGVMQRLVADVFPRWGLVYVSLVFAALHIGYRSVADLLFVLAAGLFFAYGVKRTGSLIGVSLAHGLTNVVLYLVLPQML